MVEETAYKYVTNVPKNQSCRMHCLPRRCSDLVVKVPGDFLVRTGVPAVYRLSVLAERDLRRRDATSSVLLAGHG